MPPLDATHAAGELDHVSAYAKAVQAGIVIAGPKVRLACARHLSDLETGHARGLVFDVAASERAIRFFRSELTIDIEERDELGDISSRPIPFVLAGWQAFIVGSLFGWKNAQGFRRFRRAYVEIGKGNGKSPLAAGIGHYMMLACRKRPAEVYSAATDKDQAEILFRDAVAMYRRSPGLRAHLEQSGERPVTSLNGRGRFKGSFFKPIAAEKKGKSGIRPYCALIDEVHEHSDNSVIEMMRAGTKGNQEALLFEITNSGFDKKTVCGQEHDYSSQILQGDLVNDAWFAFITCLDEGDDPFEDEACWIKANPNLGVSIQLPFIREQVQEARGMPSKEGLVRRLHFCQWTESENSAIPRATWMACEGEVDADALTEAGIPCYGGLDLSRTRDLTAFTLTWVLDATKDQWKLKSKTWFWTPADTLKERAKADKAPYQLWVEQGFLEAVPGPRIKYSWMADALLSLNARYHPVMIGADQYGLEQLLEALGNRGSSLPAEVHPQGFQRRVVGSRNDDPEKETGADDIVWWMPDSINKFEAALLERRIVIDPNPVMRMCAGGAVYEQNRTGHRMFNKDKATTRIDGMVSGAMSIGVATTIKPKKKSFWEK
jgi:phage terminase large subunit-like protein